jgi:hypothetical protein
MNNYNIYQVLKSFDNRIKIVEDINNIKSSKQNISNKSDIYEEIKNLEVRLRNVEMSTIQYPKELYTLSNYVIDFIKINKASDFIEDKVLDSYIYLKYTNSLQYVKIQMKLNISNIVNFIEINDIKYVYGHTIETLPYSIIIPEHALYFMSDNQILACDVTYHNDQMQKIKFVCYILCNKICEKIYESEIY